MSDLKISIIGNGRMGREIESLAPKRKIEVVSVIDPYIDTLAHSYKYKAISRQSIKDAEVCIDFTTPDSVIGNIKRVASLKRNIVVGTTGWDEHLDEVREIVNSSGIGLIYSPNFSPGANLYLKIMEIALRILGNNPDYDIFGQEMHHREKSDIPSGTAKTLEKMVKDITGKEIRFSSTRAGHITGTHRVGFDSESDLIEITHTAKNRRGFALGALIAAEYIRGKKGLYNQRDFVNYLMNGK